MSSLEILRSVDGDLKGEAYSRTDLTIYVSLTAFTMTQNYQFLSRDKGCTKGWPANVLPKTTTHTRYKTTTCIRYNTDKYKNTKLSNTLR